MRLKGGDGNLGYFNGNIGNTILQLADDRAGMGELRDDLRAAGRQLFDALELEDAGLSPRSVLAVGKAIASGEFDFDRPWIEKIIDWCHDRDLAFDYSSVAAPGIVVTGVRADAPHDASVVVTASYVSDGTTSAALYRGSLEDLATAQVSDWHILSPDFAGQTVTTSTLYGPNTAHFDPDIGTGHVRAVGSYKYAESDTPNGNHGMIYEGPINGVGGTWTQIDATSLVEKGDTLLNTIAHSNMGDLVVGNYDTRLATGHAFIYDMAEDDWLEMNPIGSKSFTAYGIWQNGGSDSTSYTIAGGYSDVTSLGLDAGYLVDYDSETGTFSNFTTFQYDNRPLEALISHFDGITGVDGGYNLTGDFVLADGTESGFFAHVARNKDGSFAKAEWSEIAYPGDDVLATSGNTIVGDTVLGIYVEDGQPTSFFASPSSHHGWDFWG